MFPQRSFQLQRTDWQTLQISSGICIKDDVLIHITENYNMDFTDTNFYIDTAGEMTQASWYYVVLQYLYHRSLPTPKAHYKLIKNVAGYYTSKEHNYIFLGAANIVWSSGNGRYEIDAVDPVSANDPTNTSIVRPIPPTDIFDLDGGTL